jgi:hypothetical protein
MEIISKTVIVSLASLLIFTPFVDAKTEQSPEPDGPSDVPKQTNVVEVYAHVEQQGTRRVLKPNEPFKIFEKNCKYTVNKLDMNGTEIVRAEVACKVGNLHVSSNATCLMSDPGYNDMGFMKLAQTESLFATVVIQCQTTSEVALKKKETRT